ncbi:hypothetical protein [Bombilactobacillus bombi]|uniref:hypothetical protein n=1 Tax=Bombilactobacillus bombi TaxID=1303590 RepID=UPI0015E61A6F|nr:hypothetical protein [Bombilactobacillus bombi]MBA1434862.1 hypothetical protein [Bombilactobacillus bombi]
MQLSVGILLIIIGIGLLGHAFYNFKKSTQSSNTNVQQLMKIITWSNTIMGILLIILGIVIIKH